MRIHLFIVSGLCFSMAAHAEPYTSLVRGEYSCRLTNANTGKLGPGEYGLRVRNTNTRSVLSFSLPDGRRLVGEWKDLEWETGDPEFQSLTFWSQDPSYVSTRLLVASSAGAGMGRQSDAFECAANGTPEIQVSEPRRFDCRTEGPIAGSQVRMRFALVHMDNVRDIEVIQYSAQLGEKYNPIAVEPRESLVEALNENLGVATRSDRIEIWGDADGVYDLKMVLWKKSGYRTGYLRIKGDGEEIPNQFVRVSCSGR